MLAQAVDYEQCWEMRRSNPLSWRGGFYKHAFIHICRVRSRSPGDHINMRIVHPCRKGQDKGRIPETMAFGIRRAALPVLFGGAEVGRT